MKEPDLNKFFSGNFSEKEKMSLRKWLEAKPQHEDLFIEERKLFNISVFNSSSEALPSGKRTSFRKIFAQFSKIAAIFALAFISFYLIDKSLEDTKSPITAYQTINVPFGQRINLDLPDGSKVCLNAGSTIKYPVSFNNELRMVELDGEAYFEIAKNEKLPFHVVAGDHTIEVLGTHFNVSVDKSTNTFETALFEGSVKVYNSTSPFKAIALEPNMYVFLKEDGLQVEPLTNLDRFYWREGMLCFEKVPFEEVMKTFEKSYGCKITILNRAVCKYLYTGKFLQTDGIDYALSLLQKSFYFNYSRDKDTNAIVIN